MWQAYVTWCKGSLTLAQGERGKILEIRQELPGRIHIVLVREPAGF